MTKIKRRSVLEDNSLAASKRNKRKKSLASRKRSLSRYQANRSARLSRREKRNNTNELDLSIESNNVCKRKGKRRSLRIRKQNNLLTSTPKPGCSSQADIVPDEFSNIINLDVSNIRKARDNSTVILSDDDDDDKDDQEIVSVYTRKPNVSTPTIPLIDITNDCGGSSVPVIDLSEKEDTANADGTDIQIISQIVKKTNKRKAKITNVQNKNKKNKQQLSVIDSFEKIQDINKTFEEQESNERKSLLNKTNLDSSLQVVDITADKSQTNIIVNSDNGKNNNSSQKQNNLHTGNKKKKSPNKTVNRGTIQNQNNGLNNCNNSNGLNKMLVDNHGLSNVYIDKPINLPRTGLRPIIIDGSNVAFSFTNNRFFSTKGLEICIRCFKEKGHKVMAFVPHFRVKMNMSDNPKLLDRMNEMGDVIFTPSRLVDGRRITSYDDRYIVQTAMLKGGVIVSKDNYRDLLEENPAWGDTIKYRLLIYTWVDDILMLPKDPLGRDGPTLSKFLSFN